MTSPFSIVSPSKIFNLLVLRISSSWVLPSSSVITSLTFPFVSLPKLVMPLYLAKIAAFFGFHASNRSATLGNPPVISLVLEDSNGILANTSPALIFAPSVTLIIAPDGNA